MVKWRTFINMTIMGMSWECETSRNLLKGVKHESQKIPLTLSFSHSFIIKS